MVEIKCWNPQKRNNFRQQKYSRRMCKTDWHLWNHHHDLTKTQMIEMSNGMFFHHKDAEKINRICFFCIFAHFQHTDGMWTHNWPSCSIYQTSLCSVFKTPPLQMLHTHAATHIISLDMPLKVAQWFELCSSPLFLPLGCSHFLHHPWGHCL